MAKIVLGLGASHTPLLTIDSTQWIRRAEVDFANPRLNMSDGRWLSYPQLLAEVGPRYESVVDAATLAAKGAACEAALDRVADALHAANPDVVLIVGDDHSELFTPATQPAVAIFHGAEVVTLPRYGKPDAPDWVKDMGTGYMMDAIHTLPGSPDFARGLIEKMIDAGVDVTACGRVDNPEVAGMGHSYGFIVKRLFRGKPIPIVPLLLNTYYPPNVPTAARAYDIGVALSEAIAASDPDLRVAVVASGGLSHFVVDEPLDRGILDDLMNGRGEKLRKLPRGALNSGSSEILNWVLAAGALRGMKMQWSDYQALYRTPAGTGVGAAFAVWH